MCLKRIPLFYRDELSLAFYSMTKEDKKKFGKKDIKGKYVLHDDNSFFEYLKGEEEEK